jgi:hypothetical protein
MNFPLPPPGGSAGACDDGGGLLEFILCRTSFLHESMVRSSATVLGSDAGRTIQEET